MKYFFDTEFIEQPNTIDLISIGIVAEDGREYYAENWAIPWNKANGWVLDNVKPHLKGGEWELDRFQMRKDILAFAPPEEKPVFWAYYGAYDWVVFCWLFGAMVDLPKGYPMYVRDIKQWCDQLGNPRLPKQEGIAHNALDDARWNMIAYDFLEKLGRT